MLRNLLLTVLLIVAQPVLADCTFKTGRHIDALGKPQNIQSIDIQVNNSEKYARNLLKVIVSDTRNIPPKLKKKFKATITVKYPFGECKFNGQIRQNGDWKDHIAFVDGGKPVRSLDVKLSEGNIMSSVRFKLLVPETRAGVNEILATQIFKQLGFISPETFSVRVSVNGISSIMLFQENAEKELLERNLRRESAIFEGDEGLLWSYKDFSLFELEPLSLSRLTNSNWFMKAASSESISTSAFSTLQSSYLNYAESITHYSGLVLNPNSNDPIFEEMAFALLAMNAGHAMRPHNRKFYFNPLKNIFEPIYYDGNANFYRGVQDPNGQKLDEVLSVQFLKGIDKEFVTNFTNVLKSSDLKSAFLNRAHNLQSDVEIFFGTATAQALTNVSYLREKLKHTSARNKAVNKAVNKAELVPAYLERIQKLGLEQTTFLDIKKNGGSYEGTLLDGGKAKLSTSEVAELISKNTYQNQRAVVLNITQPTSLEHARQILIEGLSADIHVSEGIEITASTATKTLYISQNNPTDWVLLSGGILTNWSIQFDGQELADETSVEAEQRFNDFGITGCLTFFETQLDNTSVKVANGGCEDSVNIISSSGVLSNLEINNAFADALDMDFSNVTISTVSIQNAGNDCYDVSGGTYVIQTGKFEVCGDKGLSIGEGSTLVADNVNVVTSNIGLSSKDYSKVKIKSANFSNVKICIEAKQKKQEFGGATAIVEVMDCTGEFEIDQHSIVKVGRNEF